MAILLSIPSDKLPLPSITSSGFVLGSFNSNLYNDGGALNSLLFGGGTGTTTAERSNLLWLNPGAKLLDIWSKVRINWIANPDGNDATINASAGAKAAIYMGDWDNLFNASGRGNGVPLAIKVLNTIPEEFCYLFVGHWLQGDLGEDRKNV